jgi:hypothetical protein
VSLIVVVRSAFVFGSGGAGAYGCVVLAGTKLRYRPGVIIGGKGLEHDCGVHRGIGYFLEPLILLGLFSRAPISIRLKGECLICLCCALSVRPNGLLQRIWNFFVIVAAIEIVWSGFR